MVSKDGPYLITGGIDLLGDNIQFAEGASKELYYPAIVQSRKYSYS
jgi:hypothetical protein